ncbi:hypothetical protein ACLOE1_03475 [Limosilactobacillus fermentum]|uniref:hypothetical protein n=2 Tax=Limosilactobacillus fermentum TaxID=1613 RepID=UPI003EB6FA96
MFFEHGNTRIVKLGRVDPQYASDEKLNAIIKETNVRGAKMSDKNPFEIVDGQVILHDEFQGIDKVILNYEQVAAIKLLIKNAVTKRKAK